MSPSYGDVNVWTLWGACVGIHEHITWVACLLRWSQGDQ